MPSGPARRRSLDAKRRGACPRTAPGSRRPGPDRLFQKLTTPKCRWGPPLWPALPDSPRVALQHPLVHHDLEAVELEVVVSADSVVDMANEDRRAVAGDGLVVVGVAGDVRHEHDLTAGAPAPPHRPDVIEGTADGDWSSGRPEFPQTSERPTCRHHRTEACTGSR